MTVGDKIPLRFDFDSNNAPSALAEFTASDVVGVSNGGTGASSLADFGASLSQTSVSANDISSVTTTATTMDSVNFFATNASSTNASATNIDSVTASSVNFFTPDAGAFNCMGLDGQKFFIKRENGATYENLIRSEEGTITVQSEDDIHFLSNTGEKFMRLNESGGNGEVELYYNNSLKLETINTGVTITGDVNGMPYPPPFGYMQLNSDDALSVDEQKLGYSNTPGTILSNTDDISWNDSLKQFEVSAAGTYECLGVVILEGGSTLVDLTVRKNNSDVLAGQPRVHSTVDPLEHTIRAVFTASAGDNINITYDATSSNTVKAITGSTMTVKRLK